MIKNEIDKLYRALSKEREKGRSKREGGDREINEEEEQLLTQAFYSLSDKR